MAREGVWTLVELAPEALASTLDSFAAPVVLADSLWLTEQHLPHFLRLKERGAQVGVVLHAFPSMIAAADAGLEVPALASSFELAALRELAPVVLVGEHFREQLLRAGIQVVVCPPGVSENFRAKPRSRSGLCRFLSLAALTPLKGIADAARIFGSWVSEPAFEWTVLGNTGIDAGYTAGVQRLIAGKSNLSLVGQQPPEVVAFELSRADVLVLPSYVENQPLVVLEAIAASVPTVAYSVGAVATLLEPPKRGLVAAIGDERELEQHLRLLWLNEPRRFEMAQACYDHQSTLPDWKQAARDAALVLGGYTKRRGRYGAH